MQFRVSQSMIAYRRNRNSCPISAQGADGRFLFLFLSGLRRYVRFVLSSDKTNEQILTNVVQWLTRRTHVLHNHVGCVHKIYVVHTEERVRSLKSHIC